MSCVEANFDGLIGPTHNYAGLSHGNIASADHALEVANPRQAALQGLRKMRSLSEMGFVQGLLPPHARPHTPSLRRLGFSGSDHQIIAQAARTPEVLKNVYAAAAMWTANAATISPSADTPDGRVHITPANLTTMFHRSIEPPPGIVSVDPSCAGQRQPVAPVAVDCRTIGRATGIGGVDKDPSVPDRTCISVKVPSPHEACAAIGVIHGPAVGAPGQAV